MDCIHDRALDSRDIQLMRRVKNGSMDKRLGHPQGHPGGQREVRMIHFVRMRCQQTLDVPMDFGSHSRFTILLLEKRTLLFQEPMQLRFNFVSGHGATYQSLDLTPQAGFAGDGKNAFQRLRHFCGVPVVQRGEQSVFVWEILIERADADAGSLRDDVGAHTGVTTLKQNASTGFKNGIDHSHGTALAR